MPVLVYLGEEHELKEGRNVIGKLKASCNVMLEGASVADTHAVLELIQDGAILTDLDSPFGTFFNGVRITQPQRVVHGDTIKFGDAGHEYKFDMTLAPSVDKSIASSFRDSLAPTFSNSDAAAMTSQKGQAPPVRKSNVFASYLDERSTDAALRDMVERQLHRRSLSKSIPTNSKKVPPLSPSQRNFIERQKLRLSQKIRDINSVMLGHTAISDTYLASWTTSGPGHPGDDPFDDDDLPETSEKAPLVIAPTKKSPSPVVIRAPAATPPVEDMNESDDDDLPETVEQRPPPAFDAASTPAVAFRKPRRSGSAQRRIDVLIQSRRVKALAQAWNAWRQALEVRQRADQQRQQRAAATRIQRFVHGVALRQRIARHVEQRCKHREQCAHVSRVVQLFQRQCFRFTMARWRSHGIECVVTKLHDRLVDRCIRRDAVTRTFRQWKSAWVRSSGRQTTLSRVLHHSLSRTKLRALLAWRVWRLETEAHAALAKAHDEHAKQKLLVQAMAAQSQAEATAWSDQAKETAQHVQREAALKAQVAALTDQVDAWKTIRKADVAVQTDSNANARAALLSHTLLKTVVGEMKEKNLRAVIDSLEGDLTASQERETRLRDEYKQLLETMVRHASQLDDAQKAAKDHQNIIDDQAKALAAMEAAHESAKQAALDKEASLTKRLDELRTATADLQRREDVKKTMESTTQQQAIALMEDAGKREAALKAQVDVLESAARKREADQFKLVLAHDVETKALADQCRQLEATVAKLQAERALPREAPAPRFEQPSTPPSSPHPNAALEQELETYKKMLELADMKLKAATTQLDAKHAAERAIVKAEMQAHMQFNAHVETFLEALVTKYDVRLLRVGGELDVLMAHGEHDAKGAQFRAASNLVGYAQEERLMHFQDLSEIHDHLLGLRRLAILHATSPPSTMAMHTMSLSPNGTFLYDMLVQRLNRLHQLHDSMAVQAATLTGGNHDTKKLEYAKFLAQTMYSRQVAFVDEASAALLHIARLQAHLDGIA
ncbi:hypothetical protein H310_11924 [Aphanomyces invadans]|uniref:FHA domain-containing protein n=1 Tax=Aphanomyces invadans TaxID=157072 RepID=A0A024TJS5_9STRA|nr:hypothetical protein H310_11924 [Aphanomyces invadans]ETV94249.1 hypothetical protein H310_11924 [Aphanomyces invadans]|eukprot:XP_008877011.1 hypothetical protein H310_11924 [Aphanomyces invadans]